MQSGIRVSLTLFIPCDSKNVDSLMAASAQAKALMTRDGLQTLSDNVEIEEAKMVMVRDRKGPEKKAQEAAKAPAPAPEKDRLDEDTKRTGTNG